MAINKASPEYYAWHNMRSRCENPNHPAWANYGRRGIAICERWRSFANFLADMGPRPAPRLTIDRINNDRGYEPGNCRWATWKQQHRNRRSSRLITAFSETKSLAQWAEDRELSQTLLRHRIDYLGWPVERALTAPVNPYRRKSA